MRQDKAEIAGHKEGKTFFVENNFLLSPVFWGGFLKCMTRADYTSQLFVKAPVQTKLATSKTQSKLLTICGKLSTQFPLTTQNFRPHLQFLPTYSAAMIIVNQSIGGKLTANYFLETINCHFSSQWTFGFFFYRLYK